MKENLEAGWGWWWGQAYNGDKCSIAANIYFRYDLLLHVKKFVKVFLFLIGDLVLAGETDRYVSSSSGTRHRTVTVKTRALHDGMR